MSPDITEIRNEGKGGSAAWIAAGIGAGVGITALVLRKRRRSPWDRAKLRANDLMDAAHDRYEPWMGMAAGAAAAGTALAAYLRSRKESGWDRAARRTREIASRVATQADNTWANLAATAAVSLASAAYANKARRRTVRGIDAATADRINALAEKGLQVLHRVRNIREQVGKVYPRVRRAIA